MTQDTPRQDMARAFADRIREARLAKMYHAAMARFGGRGGADPIERLLAWRQVKSAPQRPQAEELPPEGYRGEGPRRG